MMIVFVSQQETIYYLSNLFLLSDNNVFMGWYF
ncbi:hypothetical protein SAMN05421840_1117 [Shewanella morhuae]|uniref:Uncharacterized protein n=1 Tax=Shewanella morhuae TaxID=365591 RepID=A0A1N6YXA3_9GAMM|nr:hypothetical protein SAMN05421840_1117 [Shewanella morhuae]SUI68051.1 Uncharacterised protein [Shewanella morhuae]